MRLGARVRQEIGDGIGDALDAAGVDEVREQTLRTLRAYEDAARALFYLSAVIGGLAVARYLTASRA